MDMKKFRYWFENVYWYHYKWHTIGALFALLVVGIFIHDMVTKVEPDFQVITVSSDYISDEQFSEVSATVQAAAGDVNGDGKEYSFMLPISLAEGEMQYASSVKLAALMTDERNVLFVMDGENADIYKRQGLFEPLKSFGLAGTDGDEYLIRVDDWPVFKRCFSASAQPGKRYYAGFRCIQEDKRGLPDMQSLYKTAENVLSSLQNTP